MASVLQRQPSHPVQVDKLAAADNPLTNPVPGETNSSGACRTAARRLPQGLWLSQRTAWCAALNPTAHRSVRRSGSGDPALRRPPNYLADPPRLVAEVWLYRVFSIVIATMPYDGWVVKDFFWGLSTQSRNVLWAAR